MDQSPARRKRRSSGEDFAFSALTGFSGGLVAVRHVFEQALPACFKVLLRLASARRCITGGWKRASPPYGFPNCSVAHRATDVDPDDHPIQVIRTKVLADRMELVFGRS
ncbi:MAG TPA: hypothetical protein VGN98_05105 [Tianweitania sediminis]|jgi:hypothetical protein|nr:hypothetical protein [Tianweitania sediminis]